MKAVKNNLRKIVAALLAVFMLVAFTPAGQCKKVAADTIDSFTYDGVGYEVTDHLPYISNVAAKALDNWGWHATINLSEFVPHDGKPYKVSLVEPGAFQDSYIARVYIGRAVEKIYQDAFKGCKQLRYVSISNDNTDPALSLIRRGAFADSGITSITLPKSVKEIGEGAFSNCTDLFKVSIGSGIEKIDSSVFAGCTTLFGVTIKANGNNMTTSIGDYAFRGCTNLRNITIPDTVNSISDSAFDACGNLTIYGNPGSYAQSYANKKNIPFKLIGQEETYYTVTYYDYLCPSGTLPVDHTIYSPGDMAKVPDNTGMLCSNNSGYTFEGWCTDQAGNGTVYHPGEEFQVNQDIKLYPKWTNTVTVSKVTVTPQTQTVTSGGFTDLSATVEGDNNPRQSVVWSVESFNASITQEGRLSVGTTDYEKTIKVRATSVIDPSKSGTATVTVPRVPGRITEIKLNQWAPGMWPLPELPATLKKDGSVTMICGIQLEGKTAESDGDIVWSITGNTSTNTKLDSTNAAIVKLKVGKDETASSVKVTVASVLNPNTAASHVFNIPQSSFAIDNIQDQVYTGSPITPDITVKDENGQVLVKNTDYDIKYSDNIELGTAKVTVTGIGKYLGIQGSGSFKIIQKIINVSGVDLDRNKIELSVGSTETLKATVKPDNATNKNVTWKSNKPEVVTVDTNGKVTAIAADTATITVATVDGGYTTQCAVTVNAAPPVKVPVTGLSLNKDKIEFKAGEAEKLIASVKPDNAANKNVTWSTSDTKIATVDSDGKVTAVSAGSAVVTVAADDDKSITALCVVTVYTDNGGGKTSGGGPSGGNSGAPIPAKTAETVKGNVVDGGSGKTVSGLEAKVANEVNGTKSVYIKSNDVAQFEMPDGTKVPMNNVSKINLSSLSGNADAVLSSDGAIQVRNLSAGAEYEIALTYDLGNNRKITIGKLHVKVGSDGKVSIEYTLIDPYGIITDSSTGKPIEEANVTLHYANTERNRAAGKKPDTIVELPVIDGFKPCNNKNPQVSDASGSYGFMVYPAADYYIKASKDGYTEYKSPTIPVEQELVRWDFKMSKPLTGINRLSGLSRVDTAIEIAKADYTGKVKNVVLATADEYSDALSGSVLAYKNNAPILLVGSSSKEQQKVIDYMKSNMESDGTVYILGGTGTVGSSFEEKVASSGFKNITRLGGANKCETSVKITESFNVTEGTPVVLVNGDSYPDALSISSEAASIGMPILLIEKDGISDAVKNEISKIKPSKIYAIGLQGVISNSVLNEAASIAKSTAVRIGGADRYKTSIEVAKYFNPSCHGVCIATGNDYPDALAGSVYAAGHNVPVILSDTSISDDEANYLKARMMTGASIFGGEGAVGKTVEEQLSKLISK